MRMLPESMVLGYVREALKSEKERSDAKKAILAGVTVTEVVRDQTQLAYKISSSFLSQGQHFEVTHAKTVTITPSKDLEAIVNSSNVQKALTLEEVKAFAKELCDEKDDVDPLHALAKATKALAEAAFEQEVDEESASSNSQDSAKRSPEESPESSRLPLKKARR